MSGRGRVNKHHPDYLKYVDEFNSLRDEWARKEDEILYPFISTGKTPDKLTTKAVERLYKQYGKDIRALQDRYSYLFEK